jgi:hypothetical protein
VGYSKKGLTLWTITEEERRRPLRRYLLVNQSDASLNGVYEAQLQQEWDSVLREAGVFAEVVPNLLEPV